MYGIMFQTTDCPSGYDGTLVSKEGDWHWIVTEPDGWVPATSVRANNGVVPSDVKVFASEPSAQAFIKRWSEIYHPWYGKPNGTYKLVKLKAKAKLAFVGYEED